MKARSVGVIPAGMRMVASVPGSKSYTNRALLLAAMTPGLVRVERPLLSDDTRAMVGCLRELGIAVHDAGDALEVAGDTRDVKPGEYQLDANLSGITIRFLLALSTVVPGVQILQGKAGLNKRPIGVLVEGLRQLGADIDYLDEEGFPPVRVSSSALTGNVVEMDGKVSSQYFSAILQIAPLVVGGVTVRVQGEQISKPYIDMTIDTMAKFGVVVESRDYREYRVMAGQLYVAASYGVEGDFSSAAYFFAIAALTGAEVTVRNLNPHSAQADRRFLDILAQMGSKVKLGADKVTVSGRGVRPVDVDMSDCPDQAMTMAVLAGFADGKTVIRGVQSLRVKETERVVAVEQELAKMGIRTESTLDVLTIYGGNPRAATVDTYGDHRMAMAFAVAGTRLPGMTIKNPEVVSKTFPDFWDVLDGLVNPNVVLIGMRGTGKSTVGRLVAERLELSLFDMDAEVVRRAGKPISALVKQKGWEHFRDLETEVAKTAGDGEGLVISAGGGAVLRPQNVSTLGNRGLFVLLTASLNVSLKRIEGDRERYPLTEHANMRDELVEIWRQREAVYRETADYVLATDGRPPGEIAGNIVGWLRGRT